MENIYIKNEEHIEGENLLNHLRSIGLNQTTPCGGKGLCGKCKVKILKGESILKTPYIENDKISKEDWIKGYRLACTITIQEDLLVQLMDTNPVKANILTDGDYNTSLNPIVKKKFFNISKADIKDQRSDTDRIESIVKGIDILDVNLIKKLPYVLSRNDYKITLTYTNDEIIAIEGGDTSGNLYGLAIDIGTTTIAGVLINLNTGEEVGVYSSINPQKQYGDDVISRIDYTMENRTGLEELRAILVNEINDMLLYFESEFHIPANYIYHTSVVGNTIMLHIFIGAAVTQIATAPFNPVFSRLKHVHAGELGLNVNNKALLTSFPLTAGYIGADTLSCILVCDMAKKKEFSLMIDIGTNGEIALGNKERIVTCATAAGPAFEGGHIECGMGGVAGAINTIMVQENDFNYTTIDNAPARGICGSGLVDLLAWMLDCGIVEPGGRLITNQESKTRNSQNITDSIIEYKGKPCFLVSQKNKITDVNVYLTQKDIREIQLAKSAIVAGIRVLIQDLGVSYDDIDRVYLAGGFGNYINIKNAVRIGLIPYELKERIEPIGNGALSGAKMSVMSYDHLKEAENISGLVEYIELSTRADFQEYFIDSLEFKEEA